MIYCEHVSYIVGSFEEYYKKGVQAQEDKASEKNKTGVLFRTTDLFVRFFTKEKMASIISGITGPSILTFIGGAMCLIGAIWASVQQSNKTNEITELNKQILNTSTGGDSFPYFVPSFSSSSSFPESLTILSEGKYPIYDLSYRVTDLDDFETAQKNPDAKKNVLNIGIENAVGNLPPNAAMSSGLTMREKEYTRLTVQFTTRNKHLMQSIRIKKVGKEYKTAMCVKNTFPPNETLYLKIDDGYPLNKEGVVEW